MNIIFTIATLMLHPECEYYITNEIYQLFVVIFHLFTQIAFLDSNYVNNFDHSIIK